MSDNLRILMIFPFILKRCLTINSIKDNFLNSTRDRLRFSHRSEVHDYIIHTWVLCAKTAKEVFSLTIRRSNGYSYLRTILNNEPNALIKNLPNLHISRHLVDHAHQYATCTNTAVGTKEMQINTLQTLRHLVDGGIDDQIPHYSTRSIFMPLIIAPRLHHLLSDNSTSITNSELFNCLEIKLGIRWSRNQVEAAGFISTNIETNSLFEDIMKAYSSYYSFEQALLETRVHFYENVSYTTLKPAGNYHNVKLKVGEIVKVTRFEESEMQFGKIMNLNEQESLLDCPVYRIQHNSLDRVHPISTVLHSSNVPFIHYCNSNCSFQQHDVTNN
ncbi:8369_t:CDS:2, partial [Ambispora leptoticha]